MSMMSGLAFQAFVTGPDGGDILGDMLENELVKTPDLFAETVVRDGVITPLISGEHTVELFGNLFDTVLGYAVGDKFQYETIITEQATGTEVFRRLVTGVAMPQDQAALFAFAGVALVAGTVYHYEMRRRRENENGGSGMILATGIVGMGDARYHSRHEFASDATDAVILGFFQATAILSEAKLVSVMKSIFYDGTNIPSADPNAEYRGKLLLQYPAGPEVVELPCLTTMDGITAWFNDNKAALVNKLGEAPTAIIQADLRSERKARGR